MTTYESRPGTGPERLEVVTRDTASVSGPVVTGVLVVHVPDDSRRTRSDLWMACEQAPAGTHVVIRLGARVQPYGLLDGVPLLHLGRVHVEASDPTQYTRWGNAVRAEIARQARERARAEAERARREADLERADRAAAAWYAAHPECGEVGA
ncbi:hypothetical protein [Raineyella fluvialis]|uniref:Uncharacterized protein n=1 Tax=Raineyella fluvialis TaxID=2662261 RepID=A0A5Q2FGR8_9ACTN|nr:hypothetical protein [Raineyella fluvialis]QGF24744.1 hypothetical protein Rai3103_15145 [Raineyella fluvialis]